MTYEEAMARLWNHANLPGNEAIKREDSLVFLLWQSDREDIEPDLRRAHDDVIACLSSINSYWNGQRPSETHDSAKSHALDRSIVYAVCGIIDDALQYYLKWTFEKRFSDEFRHYLSLLCWSVGFVWQCVLAGDIDSPAEETEVALKRYPFLR